MVGPKPRISVQNGERPLSGALALTTTFCSSSSLVSPVVSTKAGTCVVNLSTVLGLPPGGVYSAFFLSVPSIVWSVDEISLTFEARSWSTKNGSYGMRVRFAGPPVAIARMKLSASSATRTPMKVPRRLRGISGGRCSSGAPRPSGAGSTRHDGILPSRGASRSGGGDEDEGLGEESDIGVLYISLTMSSMKPG